MACAQVPNFKLDCAPFFGNRITFHRSRRLRCFANGAVLRRLKAQPMLPIEQVKRSANENGSRSSNGSLSKYDGKGSLSSANGNGSSKYSSANGDGYKYTSPTANGYGSSYSSANGNGSTSYSSADEKNGRSIARIEKPSSSSSNGALKLKVVTNGAALSTSTLAPPLERSSDDQGVAVLPSDESFSWSKENYSTLQRTVDVWSFVLDFRLRLLLIDAKWLYIGGFNEDKQSARRRSTASWVRERILQLGPTFIKLGQLSSSRSDLFPAEFVEELAKLQDRVPAFSFEKAEAAVERELGAPTREMFSNFEKRPLAAASLGQVHRAVLRNGERVVVKIQRPGLKRLFDIDLKNLKTIAEYFQKSETLGGPTRDWVGIYEECATVLYQEIDYINEGRNADKFRRDFRKLNWVKVPQVYWDYTSRKVLTLEYLPGIKINDVASLSAGAFQRSLIASRAIEAYLIQILKTGFFHADPHPGNLAVASDGSLIYYDFGMMGEIQPFTREKLLDLFYAVYEEDADKVLRGLIDLGALLPTGDLGSVKKTVKFFLKNLTNQKPDQATTFSAIGEDLFSIALDQPFRFPSTFTFVLRAFSTLEGIGYTLDPSFSFTKVAAPYAQELLDVKDSSKDVVKELQRQANETRDATMAMPFRLQRIESFVQQLEAGDLKLRVRVLEAERAARKADVLQGTTMNLVAAATLLNVGVTLSGQGVSNFAAACFLGAGALSLFIFNGLKRVRRLDKFEGMIR